MLKMETGTQVPLIIDSDSNFLAALCKETEGRSTSPIIANGTQQGLEALLVRKTSVSILVVSTAFPREEVLNMIYGAHRAMPGLPVALLVTNGILLFSDDELKKMRVQTIIKKPVTFKDMMKQLININVLVRERIKQSDQDFAPIGIETKIAQEQAREDIYVRIRNDKYIKVLKAGYALGAERLERYVRRGIKSFYRSKK
jgi:hypothetical protein